MRGELTEKEAIELGLVLPKKLSGRPKKNAFAQAVEKLKH